MHLNLTEGRATGIVGCGCSTQRRSGRSLGDALDFRLPDRAVRLNVSVADHLTRELYTYNLAVAFRRCWGRFPERTFWGVLWQNTIEVLTNMLSAQRKFQQ